MTIEVKIVKDNEEKVVRLKEPTGDDADEYFLKFSKLSEDDGIPGTKKVIDFREYRKALILRLDSEKAFRDVKDFNSLAVVEQEKLHKAVEERFVAFKDAFL